MASLPHLELTWETNEPVNIMVSSPTFTVSVSSLGRVAARDRDQARLETSLPKGLEFLAIYPKLLELSLDMPEQQFLDIVKRQDLQPIKTVYGSDIEW